MCERNNSSQPLIISKQSTPNKQQCSQWSFYIKYIFDAYVTSNQYGSTHDLEHDKEFVPATLNYLQLQSWYF